MAETGWTHRKEVKFITLSHFSCVQLFVIHGLQPARLLCPWDFPGKNTGVGSHFLLQGIFLTQGSNPGLLHCRQMIYWLSYEGSPFWHYPVIKHAVSKSGLHLTRKVELFSNRTFAMTSIAKAFKSAWHRVGAQKVSIDWELMQGKKGQWLKEENKWVTTEMLSPVPTGHKRWNVSRTHGKHAGDSAVSRGVNSEWQVLCFLYQWQKMTWPYQLSKSAQVSEYETSFTLDSAGHPHPL